MLFNKRNSLYQEDLNNVLRVEGIDRLKGKTVLITGATGMVGTCLIDAIMKFNTECGAQVKVYAVGRSREKAVARLGEYYENELFTFIEHDVRAPFREELKTDYIIPLASNTHPIAYSSYPIETVEINVKGAENALELAGRCSATLLYPSSVEIYGNGSTPFTEEDTGDLDLSTSRACYTESKRVSEAMCQAYISEKGVDCKLVRLSRLFGPTMLASDTKASSQFIQKAIAGEDIVLKSDGSQLFSYTYVADAVNAILFVMLNGECGKAYNVASEESNVNLSYFARVCAERAGTSVVFDSPSEKESKGFSVASKAIMSSKRLYDAGWKPFYPFEEAVHRTIRILGKK